MIARRLLRTRVLDALQARVKQFRSREELWPLRVPRDPLSMDDVIRQALPDDHHGFDPITLRARTLLHLAWEPDSENGSEPTEADAQWEAWVIALPSGVKLYCDTGEDETRILASGGRNEGDESDRLFLRLLAESAGRHFGIEMHGGAPTSVRSSIVDREFLVELFVDLFEVTATEDSVRKAVEHPPASIGLGDFRADVERWILDVLN